MSTGQKFVLRDLCSVWLVYLLGQPPYLTPTAHGPPFLHKTTSSFTDNYTALALLQSVRVPEQVSLPPRTLPPTLLSASAAFALLYFLSTVAVTIL